MTRLRQRNDCDDSDPIHMLGWVLVYTLVVLALPIGCAIGAIVGLLS